MLWGGAQDVNKNAVTMDRKCQCKVFSPAEFCFKLCEQVKKHKTKYFFVRFRLWTMSERKKMEHTGCVKDFWLCSPTKDKRQNTIVGEE